MTVQTISQPDHQLGNTLLSLLVDTPFSTVVFVSAFVALRTVLRFRDAFLAQQKRGAVVRFVLGIDLGGTSSDVLEELLSWDCEVLVFHNNNRRATFHPKIYLFEGLDSASLFIGSNNLTDGGLYTNYEATTRFDFALPAENSQYDNIVGSLRRFISPNGNECLVLDRELLDTLIARGELPNEAEARKHTHSHHLDEGEEKPESPFKAIRVSLPPLLPKEIRNQKPRNKPEIVDDTAVSDVAGYLSPSKSMTVNDVVATFKAVPKSRRTWTLVWRKVLPKTDAQKVEPGSNPVGGVRLTQAKFDDGTGSYIDQTTYFRNLFSEFEWERELRGKSDQEHCFVPMRIIIRGTDYGVREFEISHKPSGEAGQDNYTTIFKWGREMTQIVQEQSLTGTTFSLYETGNPNEPFCVDITE